MKILFWIQIVALAIVAYTVIGCAVKRLVLKEWTAGHKDESSIAGVLWPVGAPIVLGLIVARKCWPDEDG